MARESSANERVAAALRGEPGIVVRGLTFVPSDALSAIKWNAASPFPLVAAARDLDLDFAFVRAEDSQAEAVATALDDAGTATMWVIDGPFGRVGAARGWAAALADVVRARSELAAELNAVTEGLLRDVERGGDAGASAIVVADDMSLASGFLMGPDDALELMVPPLGRIARKAASVGLPAVLHSDGDIRAFLPAIAREGFSGVHVGGMGWDSFVALFEAARAEGLAVIGGLEGTELRADHARAVGAGTRAAVLADSGGLLVADDGGVTRAEEVAALVTALRSTRLD